jgi:hypothetical protein
MGIISSCHTMVSIKQQCELLGIICRFNWMDSLVTKFANFSPNIFKQNNPCNLIDIGRKEQLDVN